MNSSRSNSDSSIDSGDDAKKIIAECKEKQAKAQNCTTLTDAQKRIFCSALDEMIAITKRPQDLAVDCLGKAESLAQGANKQNAVVLALLERINAFRLHALTDEELILFCFDPKQFKPYVTLLREFKNAHLIAIILNKEFKEALNRANIAFRVVYTLREHLFNLEKEITQLQQQKIHADFNCDFLVLKFSITTRLDRIAYFTQSGETPSDFYLQVCTLAQDSMKSFNKALPEITSLLECFEMICNMRSHLLQKVSEMRETRAPAPLESPGKSAPKSAMFKNMDVATSSPSSSPRLMPHLTCEMD